MRRGIATAAALAAGLWIVVAPTGGVPSVKDMFVATTEAAEDADGAL